MKLYTALGSDIVEISFKEVWMDIWTWLAIISPTLLTVITKSKTGAVSYNPQRVVRQLGYDQSVIQITGEMGCPDL